MFDDRERNGPDPERDFQTTLRGGDIEGALEQIPNWPQLTGPDIEFILKHLESADDSICLAAIDTCYRAWRKLERSPQREALIEKLVSLLGHRVAAIQEEAAMTLSVTDFPPETLQQMTRYQSSSNPVVRGVALAAMLRCGDEVQATVTRELALTEIDPKALPYILLSYKYPRDFDLRTFAQVIDLCLGSDAYLAETAAMALQNAIRQGVALGPVATGQLQDAAALRAHRALEAQVAAIQERFRSGTEGC